jgi:CheY-like chemotaxis protein
MGVRRPLRVFVVEDEALLAMELCDILHDLGHEVVGPVPSVEKALALLEVVAQPDVAILDANLAGETSRLVMDRLRSADVPVIVASGYGSHELGRMGLGGGTLVTKPYDEKRITNALEHVT